MFQMDIKLNELDTLKNLKFSIYPLSRDSKAPISGKHGYKDATTDYTKLPDNSNYGILLRNKSLIVVDVDRHSGQTSGVETLANLKKQGKELPNDTYIESTPNNGLHYFLTYPYKTDMNYLNTIKPFGKTSGVEIMTNNIIVAPSTVENKPYKPAENRTWEDVKPAPKWLVKAIERNINAHSNPVHISNYQTPTSIDDTTAYNAIMKYASKHHDDLADEYEYAKLELELADNVHNGEISEDVATKAVREIGEQYRPDFVQDNKNRFKNKIKGSKGNNELSFVQYFGLKHLIKDINENLEPIQIDKLEIPQGLNDDEMETKSKEFNKLTPSWLSLWLELNKKIKRTVLKSKIKNTILSKKIVQRYHLLSFPKMTNGIHYDDNRKTWQVFGKNENTLFIESVLAKLFAQWGIYTNVNVVQARLYVTRDMYSRTTFTNPLDSSNPALVAFRNGTYNMDTGKMQANDPEDYIMNYHDYELDTSGKPTPNTDKLLVDMFGDGAQFLKEYIGYMFYRNYSKFNYAVFLYGTGGQGKSTLTNYIQKYLIGEENYATVSPEELAGKTASRFAPADLYGMELNAVADIPKGYLENTAILKKLTGGDSIRGEYKQLNSFKFHNYAKMFFSANELPTFDDSSNGFSDRLIVLELKNGDTRAKGNTFWQEHDMNAVRQERDQFAFVCIQAFRNAKARGYMSVTDEMDANKSKWKFANDTIAQFMSDELPNMIGAQITSKNMYAKYLNWCEENGFKKPLSQPSLTKQVTSKLNDNSDKKTKITQWEWNDFVNNKDINKVAPLSELEFEYTIFKPKRDYIINSIENINYKNSVRGFTFPLREKMMDALKVWQEIQTSNNLDYKQAKTSKLTRLLDEFIE